MNQPLRHPRSRLFAILAAIICLVVGLPLSRCVEPGIQVQSVTLGKSTPALKFTPATPGHHPVVLLCHGVTASKETMFRLGETLATAGFVCYAMDFAGHGQSPHRFNINNVVDALNAVIHEIGPINVFVGHSMGAGAGAYAVQTAMLKPGTFIAIGAAPQFGKQPFPVVLLDGTLEEIVPLAALQAVPNARLQTFTWCDHCSEVYDPRLVNAAVAAACESAGKQPPPAPTRWRWRIVGVAFSVMGAIALGIFLPLPLPKMALWRGPIIAILLIATAAMAATSWAGAFPTLRRVPYHLIGISGVCLLMMVRNKLHAPRWIAPTTTLILTFVLLLVGHAGIWPLVMGIVTLLLLAAEMLGKIIAFFGSQRDGDIAVAILMGYAFGQWIPLLI